MRTTVRTWIVVHDGMPEHGKIEALSDRSFRALVELWCWCSRQLTDGHVPKAAWEKRTTPAVRRELVAAKLVDPQPGGDVLMHDYLDWQRSSGDVAAASEKKQSAARLGNHNRWHVREGRYDPACEHCTRPKPDPPPIAPAIADATQDGSHLRSVDNSTENGHGTVTERSTSGDPASKSTKVDGTADDAESHLHSDYETPDDLRLRDERPIAGAIRPASQTNPRGEERRGEGSYVGRGTSGTEREQSRNARPRCPKHAELPPDQRIPDCRACMQLRLQAEQQAADQAERDAAERDAHWSAVRACQLCDDRGLRERDDGALARCTHPPQLEVVS